MIGLCENTQFMFEFIKVVGPTFSLQYINELTDYVICNIATYADDTIFYIKFEQAGIYLVEAAIIGFWAWIWPARHCLLEQGVACWS